MKGLWKNSVGGWNQKDSKRKTQKRRHLIRDNGTALLKRKYDESNHSIRLEGEDEFAFMYNKPLFNFERWVLFNDRSRKYWLRMINSTDRTNLRNWIQNGDWNVEIKTHAYSKTIAWLLD